MKTLFILLTLLLIPLELFSQNINGKLGTNGQFIIRDTNNTFLSVPQTTGYLMLNRSLTLPTTTSSTIGVIYKDNNRFIHNYRDFNTFMGINSGNFTMTDSATYNTALGYSSLFSNTTGAYNTALGVNSLRINTTGAYNTAVGMNSLYSNTTGYENTAVGRSSLYSNTTGINNTALGYNAQVPSGTASNQVRIGNTSVTYAGVQIAWTITSDKRWKSDIQSSTPGLNFISKLNPVSYFRTNDDKQKTEYGFIAQELEEVLKEAGVENSGMITKDDEGRYELRYNDLFAPIVKAIQELKTENDVEIAKLKTENDGLKSKLDELKSNNEKLSAEVESLKSISEKLVKLEQMVNELSSVKHTSLSETK